MIKSLEFTLTISKCMGCAHCPQPKLAEAYMSDVRVMNMATFHTILSKLPSDTRVDFSGYSECFLNPLCAEMIKEASDSGREVHLYTTLSGLTEHQVFQLSRSRIKYTRLHAPDATGFKMDASLWIKRLHLFAATGHKFTAMAMSGDVEPSIVSALQQYGVHVEHPHMLSRAGNLGWVEAGRPIKGPCTCAMERWFQNVVLPNGTVVGCCHLYSMEIVLGNILQEPYEAIHARALDWSKDLNPPDDSPCRMCPWAKPI